MEYEALGRRIEDAWHRANRDERAFPDLALEALSTFEPDGFDLNDIARFLIATPVSQRGVTHPDPRMIRARQPGVDAEAQCIDWLLALGDPARMGTAWRERSPLLLSAADRPWLDVRSPHCAAVYDRPARSDPSVGWSSAIDASTRR